MSSVKRKGLEKNRQNRASTSPRETIAEAPHKLVTGLSRQEDTFTEVADRTGLSAERLCHDTQLIERLADLFSVPNPPYALNGGAALNMIFFGETRRVPSDIDLRCDDLEECRRIFSERFEPVSKPAPVKMHSFVDDNGIVMDLAQNQFPRIKKTFQAKSILCSYGLTHYVADVLSYDFETLFAEKIIALARKRDFKDLYDVYVSLSHEFDRKKLLGFLVEVRDHDKIDPLIITRPSYQLDGGQGGAHHITSDLKGTELFRKVQDFIRDLFQTA